MKHLTAELETEREHKRGISDQLKATQARLAAKLNVPEELKSQEDLVWLSSRCNSLKKEVAKLTSKNQHLKADFDSASSKREVLLIEVEKLKAELSKEREKFANFVEQQGYLAF